MKVLVACEFSGTVRSAFCKMGHEAISCDLLPDIHGSCDHVQQDIVKFLERNPKWDLMIAHPPCTYLANSGVHLLSRQVGRRDKMIAGAEFFKFLLDFPIDRVCIENPVMHKYAVKIIGRKQDQTIQPYEFGHPESKRTCLWLKNLPKLIPTKVLDKPSSGRWNNQTPSGQNKLGPSEDRGMIRSITYQGIAEAMAEQWG